jgi:HAE1 family hydrophobic/amphiphilic exporter-1
VIGGVVTSTVLTLLVIPTVYEVIHGVRVWARRRLGALFRSGHHAGGEVRAAPRSPRR